MRLTDGRAIDFTPKMTRNTLGGGANIDDDHILTTSTWSSQKIAGELDKKANTTTLAEAYTPGTHYYVGDTCSYLGDVYICTAEIAQAPATFDTTKWTQYVVLEEFATSAQVQAIISGYTPT